MNLVKDLPRKFKRNVPLKRHTTFRIGGPARYFFEPQDDRALQEVLLYARSQKIPVFILGAGSNLLVKDRGVAGIVVRLRSPFFKSYRVKKNWIYVGSGLLLQRVLVLSRQYGLSGLEFLAGIPATVGGALRMNAGIPQDSIGNYVEKVTVMTYNGHIKTIDKKKLVFEYRSSSLKKCVILSVLFRLKKVSPENVQQKIRFYREKRTVSQEGAWGTAGCIFKNPARASAGELIDLCGLKGRAVGGAVISSKHANFIVNRNRARAEDVLRLMEIMIRAVKKQFNVTLQPEIQVWP